MMFVSKILIILLSLFSAGVLTRAFQTPTSSVSFRRRKYSVSSSAEERFVVLNLVPLRDLHQDEDDCSTKITFLSESDSYRTCIDENGELRCDDDTNPYILCVAEEDDLPAISKMIVESFGSDAIVLSTGDLSPLEQALVQPGVNLLNAYSGAVAYAEVLSGLRYRMKNRFSPDDDAQTNTSNDHLLSCPIKDEKIAETSSLILALARKNENSSLGGIDVLATVELRLQPTDAKIPFSYPWLDTLERNIAKHFFSNQPKDDNGIHQLQPYLSNLCVAENARGRRIGKALVRCVESIAKNSWGFSKLYLHVDLQNVAAYSLYKKEGYQDVGSRWNPFWAGSAADIAYFVKPLT